MLGFFRSLLNLFIVASESPQILEHAHFGRKRPTVGGLIDSNGKIDKCFID